MTRRPFLRRVVPILAGLLCVALVSAQPPTRPQEEEEVAKPKKRVVVVLDDEPSQAKGAPPTKPQAPEAPAAISRRAEQEKQAAALRDMLNQPVKFTGFDDPETKWADVFGYLERRYGPQIDINEKAFKDEGLDDIRNGTLGKVLPPLNNLSLDTVLRRIVARVPSTSGAMYFARGNVLEITTTRAYHEEFYPGRPNGPFPPLVFAEFEKTPLPEALKKLAGDADANIVLDARAADKAKAPVTARLISVPLDTAVLLLADMADLKPVEMDGVYYVTTKENAQKLREEREKSRPAKPEEPKAAEPKPAPIEDQ
jgi:hypothetical protein